LMISGKQGSRPIPRFGKVQREHAGLFLRARARAAVRG
jgi:hypothetical protein